jgi:hypothetical protein
MRESVGNCKECCYNSKMSYYTAREYNISPPTTLQDPQRFPKGVPNKCEAPRVDFQLSDHNLDKLRVFPASSRCRTGLWRYSGQRVIL